MTALRVQNKKTTRRFYIEGTAPGITIID